MKLLSVLFLGVVMIGCGSQNDPAAKAAASGFAGQCDLRAASIGVCINYLGSKYDPAAAQNACKAAGGVYAPTHCDASRAVGTCKTALQGAGYEAEYLYYTSNLTADAINRECGVLKGAPATSDVDCLGADGKPVASGKTETRVRYLSKKGPCASETQSRTCANGAWGSWSGLYAQETCSEGSCSGTHVTCDTFSSATTCASQLGCGWTPKYNTCVSANVSDWYYCGNQTVDTDCNSIPGCSWDYNFIDCTGGIQYCEGKTQLNCEILSAKGYGCQWEPPVCQGNALACEAATTAADCNTQVGCSWK